jgi:hypothetical protein
VHWGAAASRLLGLGFNSSKIEDLRFRAEVVRQCRLLLRRIQTSGLNELLSRKPKWEMRNQLEHRQVNILDENEWRDNDAAARFIAANTKKQNQTDSRLHFRPKWIVPLEKVPSQDLGEFRLLA